MTPLRHPRVVPLDPDRLDPDLPGSAVRAHIQYFRSGVWACYDERWTRIELASYRDDPEYTDDLLPRILEHEFLHFLLIELLPGVGRRASIELDNIDTESCPLLEGGI